MASCLCYLCYTGLDVSFFLAMLPYASAAQNIWRVQAGFGHTNIDPLWHPRKQKMFDVSRIAQGEHDNIRKRLAVVLRTHLQKAAGLCLSDVCQVQHVRRSRCLENIALTLHSLWLRPYPPRHKLA